MNLFWTGVLTVPIGLILASAFPAMVVYAQDLLPGRTGTVSGLVFGLPSAWAASGRRCLGTLADHIGIVSVYQICAFLPLHRPARRLLPERAQAPGPGAA